MTPRPFTTNRKNTIGNETDSHRKTLRQLDFILMKEERENGADEGI
ncbi:MAG: hypothetical protein RBS08_04785 [Bdellovibrionales bacterium]|nr:hypothetical protein [Bdellovibrionales bacterium]